MEVAAVTTAEIVKVCLTLTSVALSVAALIVARRAAKHARRAEAAHARARTLLATIGDARSGDRP